jgi:hypothetical protein
MQPHLTPEHRAVLLHLASIIDLAMEGPSPEDLASAPVLDPWRILLTEEQPMLVLGGRVQDHPLLPGDRIIATSQLIRLEVEAGWARTISRWYRLGQPLSVIESGICGRLGVPVGSMGFQFRNHRQVDDPHLIALLLDGFRASVLAAAQRARSRN